MMETRLPSDLQTIGRYPLVADDHVRFSDLDALGHVASTSVHVYFASARVMVLQKSVPDWPRGACVPVLKATLANHHHELFFPTPIRLGAGVSAIGTTSFTIATAVWTVDERCAGVALNTFVLLSADTRQPTPLNTRIRTDLERCALRS